MKKYNVLVFPGGTEIGLEICKALKYCKDVNIHAASVDIPNHAPYEYSSYHTIPSIKEPRWLEKLNDLVEKLKITHIIPAYDDIIVELVKHQGSISAKVVSSPLETCLITRSKKLTYAYLNQDISTPEIFDCNNIEDYPVFIKPERGQGSQNAFAIYNKDELQTALSLIAEPIITEYLPGEEYTVDCFSHRNQGLLFCSGRKRERTRAGISMSCEIVNDPIFYDMAQAISRKLKLYGAWFFQLKRDCHGNFKLLEIAPRIAGTMVLNRVRGINFPLLSLYESENINIQISLENYEVKIDRCLHNSYKQNIQFDVVYIDYDDTIIVDGKINSQIIKFLIQCINKKIKIILLTKHENDLNEHLKKHRLHGLFDEIIHINRKDSKSKYIKHINAIFIDDSFTERIDVSREKRLLTFDCSMIEVLISDSEY